MKESEAWRILAEEHDAGRSGSRHMCVALDNCVPEPGWDGQPRLATIPADVRERMTCRIRDALDGFGPAYPMSLGSRIARDSRVLACLMFSEQAKDEERSK